MEQHSSGTRYRIPRKVKKARHAVFYGTPTPKQRLLVGWCSVIRPLGWKSVRRGNAHVAMGDTTTCRRRERWEKK